MLHFAEYDVAPKKHFPFTDPDANLSLDYLQTEHLNIESAGSFLSNVPAVPGPGVHVSL